MLLTQAKACTGYAFGSIVLFNFYHGVYLLCKVPGFPACL